MPRKRGKKQRHWTVLSGGMPVLDNPDMFFVPRAGSVFRDEVTGELYRANSGGLLQQVSIHHFPMLSQEIQ